MQRLVDISLVVFAALVALAGIWYFFIRDDPVVDQPIAAVREASEILRRNALATSSVDWPSATTRAEAMASSTGRRSALDSSLHALVAELKDSHSHYIGPEYAKAMEAAPQSKESLQNLFDIREGAGNVLIVQIHAFASINVEATAQAAAQLNGGLKEARASFSCGLVVDLADNRGGNMWPMLNGLYSVVPSTTLAYFVSGLGERTPIHADWPYAADKPDKRLPKALAVVVSDQTSSSGEFVAVSLLAHPNARLFGESTAGMTTGNQLFPLRTGGFLAVATTRLETANGSKITGPVVPTVRASRSDAIRLASEWLGKECAQRS